MVPHYLQNSTEEPPTDGDSQQDRPLDFSTLRPLVDEFVVNHGPHALLGEFVLQAYAECQRRGVWLSFAPIEWLIEINRQHQESWSPLLSIFDHRFGQLNADNSFCIVGRNDKNEIIYTRAARLYEIGIGSPATDFRELTETMLHLYGQPSDAPDSNESWSVSGPAVEAMQGITGRVAFSGAVWCHPDFRKRGFTSIASSIGRACSHAVWDNDYTVTFMAQKVVEGGHARKTGYDNVSWTVHARNASIGDLDIAFMWVDRAQTMAQIAEKLATLKAPVGGAVVDGQRHQQRLIVR